LHGARARNDGEVLITFFGHEPRTHYLNAAQARAQVLEWASCPSYNENAPRQEMNEISSATKRLSRPPGAILLGCRPHT